MLEASSGAQSGSKLPHSKGASPRTCRSVRGFTLVELLVVIAIIGLISAVALPVVLPALNERRVSESARLLQAMLAGTRDAAIRANAPRGIRLLPDPVLNPGTTPGVLAANRIVPIEPAPAYMEGQVVLHTSPSGIIPAGVLTPITPNGQQQLVVAEVLYTNVANHFLYTTFPNVSTPSGPPVPLPGNPTTWYWNVRQGDRIRFNDSGPYYTIAGPMKIGPHSATGAGANPERYINNGPPNTTFPRTSAEFLILVNGVDDDQNGYVDDSFDGLDNNNDGIVDPLYNGLDDDGDGIIDNEFPQNAASEGYSEIEQFDGTLIDAVAVGTALNYTIYRRPVVSPGARETTLPAGIVIDLTTWNAPTLGLRPERSRLPVDPYTNYVDIMVSPNGQVVQGGAGSSGGDINALAPAASQPFYHFWLTEREGVVGPLWGINTNFKVAGESDILSLPNPNPSQASGLSYLLPMPKGTPNYPAAGPPLTGERRLVTLFVKTGQIVANSVEIFNAGDISTPFYDAQTGIKESQ